MMDNESKVNFIIDDWFDEGWNEFVKQIQEENRISNYRLMKVVGRVRGKAYLNSLKSILKTIGAGSLIRFSDEAKGVVFNKPEWSGIGDVIIDQRSTPVGMRCDIYMPVKKGKFLHVTTYQ